MGHPSQYMPNMTLTFDLATSTAMESLLMSWSNYVWCIIVVWKKMGELYHLKAIGMRGLKVHIFLINMRTKIPISVFPAHIDKISRSAPIIQFRTYLKSFDFSEFFHLYRTRSQNQTHISQKRLWRWVTCYMQHGVTIALCSISESHTVTVSITLDATKDNVLITSVIFVSLMLKSFNIDNIYISFYVNAKYCINLGWFFFYFLCLGVLFVCLVFFWGGGGGAHNSKDQGHHWYSIASLRWVLQQKSWLRKMLYFNHITTQIWIRSPYQPPPPPHRFEWIRYDILILIDLHVLQISKIKCRPRQEDWTVSFYIHYTSKH